MNNITETAEAPRATQTIHELRNEVVQFLKDAPANVQLLHDEKILEMYFPDTQLGFLPRRNALSVSSVETACFHPISSDDQNQVILYLTANEMSYARYYPDLEACFPVSPHDVAWTWSDESEEFERNMLNLLLINLDTLINPDA